MSTIILRGEIQRDFAIAQIRKLNLDKLFQIEIKPYRKPRTLDQNVLFHGWVAILARETGNDFDDTKEALKSMFLPPRFVEIDSKTVEVRRSTAKLSTKEMGEFCTRIQAWASSEFAIILPTRDDQLIEERTA